MIAATLPLEIGLCSWTLQLADEPALRSEVMRFGLRSVHLAVGSLVGMPEGQRGAAIAQLRASPLIFTAGMIGFAGEDYSTLKTIEATGGFAPDGLFEARLAHTLAAAQVAHDLGLALLTGHAGFIPDPADAAFGRIVARLQRVADALAPLGITFCLETGQETADTLAKFLIACNRPNLGVNFDPANMILYGKGNPVDGAIRLARWIKHVHAKDARKTLPAPADPAAWCGVEVPVGQGDARVAEVIQTLYRTGYRGPVAIEREVGPSRGKDIAIAITALKEAVSKL